jgi:hypothetical protein
MKYFANGTCIDLTDMIGKKFKQQTNEYLAFFNPSICSLDDPTFNHPFVTQNFLVSFRYFGHPGSNDLIRSPLAERGPWGSGWKAPFDGTAFLIMRIKYNYQHPLLIEVDHVSDLLNIKVEDQNGNIHYYGRDFRQVFLHKPNLLQHFVDTRVFRWNDKDTILLSFNIYPDKSAGIHPLAQFLKGGFKPTFRGVEEQKSLCEDWCTRMGVALCSVDLSNNTLVIKTFELAYNSYSAKNEKNWTFFKTGPYQLFLAYSLSSDHNVFMVNVADMIPTLNKHKRSFLNPLNIQGVQSYFTNSIKTAELITKETLPDGKEKQQIFFSLSTPAVDYDSDHLIAVGHFKVTRKFIETTVAKKDDLFGQSFMRFANEKINRTKEFFDHPEIFGGYYYFMFLYIIHKSTLQIIRTSSLFVFDNCDEPSFIYFPTGIEKMPTSSGPQFIISYGVGDIQTKFFVMTSETVHKLISTAEFFDIKVLRYKHLHKPESIDEQQIGGRVKQQKYKNKKTSKSST